MNKSKKIILYSILLLVGLLTFILQLFVFESPDGVMGFILCMFCIYLIVGSIIKLCKLSSRLKNTILSTLDILFFLP